MPRAMRPPRQLQPKASKCWVCGPDNPAGFRIPFVREGEKGARAVYEAREEHTGWPELLHGGVLFTLLDEAVAWAVHFQGLCGVTARMEARLHKAVTPGQRLVIRGWMMDKQLRLALTHAEIRVDTDDGDLVAEAESTLFLEELAPSS